SSVKCTKWRRRHEVKATYRVHAPELLVRLRLSLALAFCGEVGWWRKVWDFFNLRINNMFLFFDSLHKLSWFTFVWEDVLNVGFILLWLLAVVAAMVAQKPRDKLKDIVTLYPGFSGILQKTLFLLTLRLGYIFLVIVGLLKIFVYFSYYVHIDAV